MSVFIILEYTLGWHPRVGRKEEEEEWYFFGRRPGGGDHKTLSSHPGGCLKIWGNFVFSSIQSQFFPLFLFFFAHILRCGWESVEFGHILGGGGYFVFEYKLALIHSLSHYDILRVCMIITNYAIIIYKTTNMTHCINIKLTWIAATRLLAGLEQQVLYDENKHETFSLIVMHKLPGKRINRNTGIIVLKMWRWILITSCLYLTMCTFTFSYSNVNTSICSNCLWVSILNNCTLSKYYNFPKINALDLFYNNVRYRCNNDM